MILTDAGPLIAILDRGDEHHQTCVDCLAELTGPMLTTWPAFTEAMYLLGEAGGVVVNAALLSLEEKGDLEVADVSAVDRARMRALLDKDKAPHMDPTDAAPVVYV